MEDCLLPLDDASFGTKSVAYTGTAGTTGNFPAGAPAVLVWTTTDAHVRVGDTVTATTASLPVPAYTPVRIEVPQGSGPWRVSAIQISAGGTVYAKPLAH